MNNLEYLREQLVRPAILFEPGGSDQSSVGSFFGKVEVGARDETWPVHDGRPMIGLLQLNLDELVYRPPGTEDVRLLTFFVDSQGYPENTPNGQGWLIRTYKSLSALTPIKAPDVDFGVVSVPLGPPALVEDYPCFDDLEEDIDDDLWDLFQDSYPTVPGVKLGGWPSLIQSEIFWAPFNRHPAEPQYVMQIDSLKEAKWQWGHDGCAYIGRGTSLGHKNDWTFDWQCF